MPEFAIPRAFFHVDDVPKTLAGKVDHVWLRESAVGTLPLATEYVAPRDAHRARWRGSSRRCSPSGAVGVHDDFFELGGDSLSVVDLLAGLAEELDLELSASGPVAPRHRGSGRRPARRRRTHAGP